MVAKYFLQQIKINECYIPLQPTVLDKLAHGMLHARHNYQRILLKYVSTLRDIHTLKKVNVRSLSDAKCLDPFSQRPA